MEELPTNEQVYKWFASQDFQVEQGEQEYLMLYEIDLPKIIRKFLKDFNYEPPK